VLLVNQERMIYIVDVRYHNKLRHTPESVGGCCVWAEAYLCILIHATVWPQYTNVTERQDNSLIA